MSYTSKKQLTNNTCSPPIKRIKKTSNLWLSHFYNGFQVSAMSNSKQSLIVFNDKSPIYCVEKELILTNVGVQHLTSEVLKNVLLKSLSTNSVTDISFCGESGIYTFNFTDLLTAFPNLITVNMQMMDVPSTWMTDIIKCGKTQLQELTFYVTAYHFPSFDLKELLEFAKAQKSGFRLSINIKDTFEELKGYFSKLKHQILKYRLRENYGTTCSDCISIAAEYRSCFGYVEINVVHVHPVIHDTCSSPDDSML